MKTVEVLCPESGQPITYTTKRLVGGEVQVESASCPAGDPCTFAVSMGGHRELVTTALGL